MKAWRRSSSGVPVTHCQFAASGVLLSLIGPEQQVEWAWGGADPVTWFVQFQRLFGAVWATEATQTVPGVERFVLFTEVLVVGESYRALVGGTPDPAACDVPSNTVVAS